MEKGIKNSDHTNGKYYTNANHYCLYFTILQTCFCNVGCSSSGMKSICLDSDGRKHIKSNFYFWCINQIVPTSASIVSDVYSPLHGMADCFCLGWCAVIDTITLI